MQQGFSRRSLVAGAAAMAVASIGRTQAAFPNRVMSIKSGMAPGATADVMARDVARMLSERVGQPVVVEPLLGSAGLIAAQRVTASPADGYTLLFSSNGLISNQAMRRQAQLDVSRDLVIVSPVAEGYVGMYVNTSLGLQTVQDFIAYAKAQPGKINYGSTGIGGIVHLLVEDFRLRTGLDIVHVPYKGIAELVPDLMAGTIHMTFADTSSLQSAVTSGKVRMIALSSKTRLRQYPSVQTFEEGSVRDFNPTFWYGLYAPRGTPAALVERLNAEIKAVLASPEAQQRLGDRGYVPIWMPAAEGLRKVADELGLMNRTIDASRIERQ